MNHLDIWNSDSTMIFSFKALFTKQYDKSVKHCIIAKNNEYVKWIIKQICNLYKDDHKELLNLIKTYMYKAFEAYNHDITRYLWKLKNTYLIDDRFNLQKQIIENNTIVEWFETDFTIESIQSIL